MSTYSVFFIEHYIGVLGYTDGSVGAAIVAVLLVHCVIAAYVYAAWKEGPTTITAKQD